MHRIPVIALPLVVALLCFAAGRDVEAAATWDIDWDLAARFRYNDNPAFVVNNNREDPSFSTVLSFSMNMERASQRSALMIRPQVTRSFYTAEEDKGLEATNLFLDADWHYSTPRNRFDVAFSYSDVDLLTAQFGAPTDIPETGDEVSGSTGSLSSIVDDTRTVWRIAPAWTHELSEKNRVRFNLGFTTGDYSFEFTNRFDYEFINGSIVYIHQLRPRHSVNLAVRASNYRSTGNPLFIDDTVPPIDFAPCSDEGLSSPCIIPVDRDTDTIGLTAGYDFQWTPTTLVTLGAGQTKSDIIIQTGTQQGEASDRKNTVLNLGITKFSPTTSYAATLIRTLIPNTEGNLVTENQLRVSLRHRLSPLFVVNIGGRAAKQESPSGETDLLDRIDFRADLRLTWFLSRDWSIDTGYFWRNSARERGDTSSEATANEIFATVAYHWGRDR